MPQTQQPQEDAILFKDLYSLLKKKKHWIIFTILLGSLAMSIFGLTRPVMFHSEASFKDRGKTKDSLGTSNLASLLTSSFSNQQKSDAKSLMMSRKLLERVVYQLGLQASLQKFPIQAGLKQKIFENFTTEYYYLRKIQNYPIPDQQSKIFIEKIIYTSQIPKSLTIIFTKEPFFKVIDVETGEILGTGAPNLPFENADFSFVVRINETPEESAPYLLHLFPMDNVIESLRNRLSITSDPDDSSLLQLAFDDPNRRLSAQFLNALMRVYQEYQREEQDRISAEQISYLNRREKEMVDSLEQILTTYASQLSDDTDSVGYIESEKGMELLTKELQMLRQQYMHAELNLQRFEEFDTNHCIYQAKEQPEYFNELVSKIKELDARSDQIELALRTSHFKTASAWQESFSKHIEDLNELRHRTEDAQIVIASLKSEKYPLPAVRLMDHPNYLVNSWNEELNRCLEKLKNAHPWEEDTLKEELTQYRLQFINYLSHLLHYLEVSQKSIKERLEHQQFPQTEFQGINLDTASELYITYSKQLSDLENQALQYEYMIDQLYKPGFEISSFSSAFQNDPVSLDLTKKASQYVVAIQDDSNHGTREKERIQVELETLKKFYALHLNQTLELTNLKQLQLKAKIESLQSAVLDLIQQQKSILVNQLAEAVAAQKQRLKQEKNLISRQTAKIQKELNQLPKKWASEKLIEHQIDMNARMVEELTKLVESKNISSNLEIAQSAPLDLATPPVKPLRPHLLLYAILGAIFGMCISCGFLFFNAFVKGFAVSQDHLAGAGVNIGGTISRLQETEMNILSSLIKSERGKFAVIGDLQFSFSRHLAKCLAQQGKKLFVIELGKAKRESIESHSSYETLFIEENASEAYNLSQVLKDAESSYDYVILSVSARPLSATSSMVLDLVETAYLLLKEETNIELQPLIQKSSKQNLVFILP